MADITDLIFLAGGKGGEVAALIPDVIVDTKYGKVHSNAEYVYGDTAPRRKRKSYFRQRLTGTGALPVHSANHGHWPLRVAA